MPDKALLRIIVLIILIPINRWSSGWIFDLMCKAAGKTKHQFKQYLITTNRSIKTTSFYSWMMRTAPHPRKFSILYRIYQTSTAPHIFIVQFAILGLFTHGFDTILDCATVVMAVIPLVLSIAGVIYRMRQDSNSK